MKATSRCGKIVYAALLLLVPGLTYAQGTREDYLRAEGFLPWNVRRRVSVARVVPHWIGGGERFWYRKEGPAGKEFLLVDAARNTCAPAFDYAKLAAALSRAANRQYQPTQLPFDSFDFIQEGKAIRFDLEGVRWACALGTYECTPDPEKGGSLWETLSPDGKWAAYVEHYNLYLRDVSSGQVVQLTRDGEKGWDYATPLPSLRLMVTQGTEDVHEPAGVFWSPDSSKFVTYRIDARNAGQFTSIQFVPSAQLRPKAYSYVYPLPGEMLATAEAIIFEVPSGKRIKAETAPLELPFQEGPDFEWFKDSRRFHYTFFGRGYKEAELREVDGATGKQRMLIKEHSDTRVDPGETAERFINDGAEILWTSVRDGWNHIYLYNGNSGQLENQVTKGEWAVRRVEFVDEKARQVYFLASGRERDEDPYQAHLYAIDLKGERLRLVTPEDADHAASVAPNGAYLVDSWSRPNLPGESVLRRAADGSVVRVLERTDASPLLETGWKYPEPFHGKAADGKTDIYGLIWRPSNFDSAKKYPVIEQIYTGPQGFFVPKSFAAAVGRGGEQSMAELGFVVVMVDGRGTGGRSRAFHDYSYKNLGGEIDDHVALIRQMAARYTYMDLSRVGVYGTSAGGYDAAHALLLHPEFYKVGVSISGDHDPRLDKAWWNELYQGYPVGPQYQEQSNVTLADRLEGHLLLVHGDVDDNVHPVETMRLVDALIKANKNFDMLFVPNMFHGEGESPYLIRRRWDYFVKHLLGVEPPADFKIKPQESTRRPSGRT
jgi:dipeptidyl aminopeptidase/acylaminoacyl peptidase